MENSFSQFIFNYKYLKIKEFGYFSDYIKEAAS